MMELEREMRPILCFQVRQNTSVLHWLIQEVDLSMQMSTSWIINDISTPKQPYFPQEPSSHDPR